jgi:hypothetical protein
VDALIQAPIQSSVYGWRVVFGAVIVATGVTADRAGRGSASLCAITRTACSGPVPALADTRGRAGVQQVIRDAHKGLKSGMGAHQPARQGCTDSSPV